MLVAAGADVSSAPIDAAAGVPARGEGGGCGATSPLGGNRFLPLAASPVA